MGLYNIFAVETFEYNDGRRAENRFLVGSTIKRKYETRCMMVKRVTHGIVPGGCKYVHLWGKGTWSIDYHAERIEQKQISFFELMEELNEID